MANSFANKKIKIVAVGDSITYGYLSSNPALYSWPKQLENMINHKDKFEIVNLGVSARTMMKTGDYPYWKEK